LYGPEKLTAYEIGMKAQWLENRLRTNFAVFRQDYDQKQIGVQTITPSGIPVGRVINSGAAKIDGFEADIQWRATDHLTLGAAYSYLDARYTKFAFRTNSSTDAIRFGDCTRATQTVPATGGTAFFCDVDALRNRSLKLEDVPEHSLVLQGRYERPLAAFGGSRWYVESDWQVQTERFVDPANRRWVEDYVLGNLRFGVADDDGRWEAILYINNVTDDDTILSANDNPGEPDAGVFDATQFGPTDALLVSLPDPRLVGLRFNWRFGGQ
jgi:outer membrane receptor protein involved in Fe transport